MKKILCVLTGVVSVIMWVVNGPNVALAESADGMEEVSAVDEVDTADGVDAVDGVPELYIRAVNPGYTVGGVNNVGEMIEIARGGDSDELILLAGLTLDYTNSSGNRSVLVEFPEHTFLTGESILLRLASSPESELAAMTYSKTLAFKAGGLRLMWGEEVIDTVCWDSSVGCEREFKSKEPTVLVQREVLAVEDSGYGGAGGSAGGSAGGDVVHEWVHVPVDEYEVKYDSGTFLVNGPDGQGASGAGAENGHGLGSESLPMEPKCKNVEFSEILSYYAGAQSEQFIELHNVGMSEVSLDGCLLKYKNKTYPLNGMVVAGGYFVRYLTDFSVAKNPSKVGVVELLDVDFAAVDTLEYPHGQKKGVSYALIGYDGDEEVWEMTYAVTPGAANEYQEFRSCEVGKVINPETGNCVKGEGVVKKEKICEDGYYLNEETGRCRKIVENDGADFKVEPETYEEGSSFVGIAAVLVVVTVALFYIIFEFRHEIKKKLAFFRR